MSSLDFTKSKSIKNKPKFIGAQLSVNVVAVAVIDIDADADADSDAVKGC